MKKITVMMMTAVMAAGLFAAAAKMSLSEARAKIGDVIQTPAMMTKIVKQLSAEDQVKFLAEVNEAIENMPGSNEEKSAKFLNVNSAALKGAAKGNLSTMLAEVFATVPPESLTIINERFAADLFNRAADPSVTYTDADYMKIVESMMKKINDRVASAKDPGVRAAFAGLMFIRASNGSPADIRNQVTEMLPFDAQNIARTEWFSPALGEGEAQSYEPMLEAAAAGQLPANELVMRLAGPQMLEMLLPDLVEWVPMATVINESAYRNGANLDEKNEVPMPVAPNPEPGNIVPKPEPGPYDGQFI